MLRCLLLLNFIEDYINNKLPNNFKYDYFEQNKDELINFRSIFFNINDALALINGMNKCQTEIFKNPGTEEIFKNPGTDLFKKTYEKLTSKNCKNIFDELLQKQNGSMKKEVKNERDNIVKDDDIYLLLDDFVILNFCYFESRKENAKK